MRTSTPSIESNVSSEAFRSTDCAKTALMKISYRPGDVRRSWPCATNRHQCVLHETDER